ncbi:hypothetical protein ACI3KS_05815 [Microbacterium sp. ZW T5_45]|uniref:hypothetical protein n=1 Tax=Microbacterium sp. ZW T5_45 TaxID=3378080 RepID=UPI00385210F6
MRRALLMVGLVLVCLLPAQPASAATTTQIVQGDIIRLVSIADWDAAASLLPGDAVQWDVEVSAQAPDPGTVTIGLSATGSTELLVDAAVCMRPWTADGCPGGERDLRSGWSIPRDGTEIAIVQMADTETAHVRLSVALGENGGGGRTDIRIHASGVGDQVSVGQDEELAATGMSAWWFGTLGGGAVLLAIGVVLVTARRRGFRHDEVVP